MSGNLANVLAFRAGLRSAQTNCDIEVRVDARALARLLERIGPGAIRAPRMIAKVVEGLLATALSSPDCSLDPQRVSQWELGETAMASLAPEEAQRLLQ